MKQYDLSEFAPQKSNSQKYDLSEFAPQQNQTNQSGFMGALSNAIPTAQVTLPQDIGVGLMNVGRNVINAPHNIASYFSPQLGSKIPSLPNTDYFNTIGNTNPSQLDRGLAAGSEIIPFLAGGELAGGLGLLGRASIGAAAGATQAPNSPLLGATLGGLGGAAPEVLSALKPIGSGISDLINAFRPAKQVQSAMNTLGAGQGIEGNAQSAASDIKNLYDAKVKQGEANYQPIFKDYGDQKISQAQFNGLPQDVKDSISYGAKKLLANYQKDPTLENAHELQSQIGYDIRKFENNPALSPADNNTLDMNRDVRSSLLGDIKNYFSLNDSKAGQAYQDATNWWHNNIAPFRSNDKLMDIASGNITNPRNLTNIFKSPEPDLVDISNQLGDQFKNKVIYDATSSLASKPNKLSDALSNLENQRLSSYDNPQIQELAKSLGRSLILKKGASKAGLLLGAGAIGGGLTKHFL